MSEISPDMNLRFAWAVIMLKLNQHDVAAIFNVNAGRVAEAVKAVSLAIADPVHFVKRDDDTMKDWQK